MNINKMLRQGKLIPPFGNTELLTKNVWLLCIDIQMLNEKLNDIKELVNGDYGYRRYMEKDVKHYQPLIDEKEEEMLSVKDLIKQKKKELEEHPEFNIRIDGSVIPSKTYDLTKDEMPCRRPHGRTNNGEYVFYDERGRLDATIP